MTDELAPARLRPNVSVHGSSRAEPAGTVITLPLVSPLRSPRREHAPGLRLGVRAGQGALHPEPLPEATHINGMVARFLIALIRVYQLTLSRLIRLTMGNVCRFEPSCSQYAAACLKGHGALRGSLLSLKRLCRCHPFHPGGYDPPPPPRDGTRIHASEPAALPDPASPVNPVTKVPILTESAEASAGRGRAP